MIHIDVHFHLPGETQIMSELARLSAALTSLETGMTAEFDALTAEVTETKTTIDSAIALIQGLKTMLEDALASGDPVTAIEALRVELDASQQALAAAVVANTPPTP